MRHTWLVLLLVGIFAIGWGLHKAQFQTVKRYAETLCTSCIGLAEKGPHR